MDLMSSANVGDFVRGAPSGVQNADQQPYCPPEVVPGVQRNLQADRAGPQGGVTAEIIKDRGRSSSTDLVPSSELLGSYASGMLRNEEIIYPPQRAAVTIPVFYDRSVLSGEQGSITNTPLQLTQPLESVVMQVGPDEKEKPRKRRYKPKILSATPRDSPAKRLRVDEYINTSPSVPIKFATISATVLRMKILARIQWAEGTNKRAHVKQKFTKQGKLAKAAKYTPCINELEETLVVPTQLKETEEVRLSRSVQLSVNVSQFKDRSVVELTADAMRVKRNAGGGREPKYLDSKEALSSTQRREFSYLQKSLVAENSIKIHETSSWAFFAGDQESSNSYTFELPSPPESDQGNILLPDLQMQAFLSIPGNIKCRTKIHNLLNPIDNDCATHVQEAFEVSNTSHHSPEDLPSTPRTAVPIVSIDRNPSFLMPLSSPPPLQATDWYTSCHNEEYEPHKSDNTTRRALNFDTHTKDLRVESYKFNVCKVAVGKKQHDVLVTAMQESIPCEESQHHAAHDTTSYELQVPDTDLISSNYVSFVNVSLAKDLSDLRELCNGMADSLPRNRHDQRREEELQIVAYDEGSKKIVVHKDLSELKRRLRFKPKVYLDFNTVNMFKTLTSKGANREESEQDSSSWEKCRQQWQNRAHRFISIMRQVQGNRAFSRWKGSVMDSVGGAFLTQNVSDFLSSNAFMALRARFPSRPGVSNEETSLPLTEAPPPVEHDNSTLLQKHLTSELKNYQFENKIQRASSMSEAALISHGADENNCVNEVLPELAEILSLRSEGCHVDYKDHALREVPTPVHDFSEKEFTGVHVRNGEMNVVLRSTGGDWNESGAELLKIPDLQASKTTHRCESPHERTEFNSHKKGRKICEQIEHESSQLTIVDKNPVCSKEKFASSVQENGTSLTVLGKEKILAATLDLVLGKHQIATEKNKGESQTLRNTRLRPRRNALRDRTDNYRYRQTVSFRMLRGEARANWEAGFVMKSQKYKWEPLRTRILADQTYSRDPLTEDCVNWNAVQRASVHEVADVIKNRGQHHALAGRLKAFLDRVHRDQNGVIDLEWIRKLPPEDAKAFLLSFRGVGLKSVECIRLLSLHHPSFPVDTNVGRIAVRLGWVPLEPLPEQTQLHLLELYPIQSHIQQYLWPRLCNFDQQTLYELHYHMITFGKVFCTKSKPNCNACPLRSECKHYASSYATAKLLLKWAEGPENKEPTVFVSPEQHPAPEAESVKSDNHLTKVQNVSCLPIVEEPSSPEPYTNSIPDIEESPFQIDNNGSYSSAQIATGQSSAVSMIIRELRSILDIRETKLDIKTGLVRDDFAKLPETKEGLFASSAVVDMDEEKSMVSITNTMAFMEDTETSIESIQVTTEDHHVLHENMVDIMDLKEVVSANSVGIDKDKLENLASPMLTEEFNHLPSQEVMLLPPCANLAPAPVLKNVQRLRTVHYVECCRYELPDNHPLLFEMDKREPDDPCLYLLAIWSPDEVPATMPKIDDDDASNPFASSDDYHLEQTVPGTLLIPCKTAMKGYFPLNGTYFQVNEVFADHTSSLQPIAVPRTLLWSLRRRYVYFSTAVSNLFKDMSLEEIRCCFQKGYVCLRAFDLATRQPKILSHRLHQSGARIVKAPLPHEGKGAGRPRNYAMKGKN